MRGLVFGNSIDELLKGGLASKSMTFLYGKNADRMLNLLCGNSIRIFGERALFIDAANSYDPYLIAERCSQQTKKNEQYLRKFIESITVYRAFTCYQLKKLITKELEKDLTSKKYGHDDLPINSIFVSGIGSVFNEQDNTEAETQRLQLFMASSLRRIASDRTNRVQFVVASSNTRSEYFVLKSDIAIKLFRDEKTSSQKAMLTKHYTRQFAAIDI